MCLWMSARSARQTQGWSISVSRWIVIERDDEDRNPHWAYALMLTATVLGVLAVIVGLCAIVTVFF
jgi:hypothetical protein